jgi:recombination protein RecA
MPKKDKNKKAVGKKKSAAKKKTTAKKKTGGKGKKATAKKKSTAKKTKAKKDKKPPKNLAEFVKSITTGTDALDVFLCTDPLPADTTYVPTRSPLLNLFLSESVDGGIPIGRVIEIFGQPDSGKTSLLTEAMIAFQQVGGVVIFHDSDFKFNRERAERRGWNPKETIYIPDVGIEDILDKLEKVVIKLRAQEFTKDKPILFAWDSAPSTPLRANVPGAKVKMGKDGKPIKSHGGMMEAARIMWDRVSRRLAGFLSEQNVTLIATSPEIVQLRPGFKSTKTTALGGAIKFLSTIRIKTWRGGLFKFASAETEPAAGVYISMNAVKHGLRIQPDKQVSVSYLFDHGFTSYY